MVYYLSVPQSGRSSLDRGMDALIEEKYMSNTMVTERTSENKTAEFGAENLKANAALYVAHKRALDAIATGIAKPKGGYDNFEDFIVQIRKVWETLRNQVDNGAKFTPPVDMGFGSNNASQIAGSLTGDRTSVGDIRKAFATLGK